jgi:Protein of unknown function (DUF1761)
MREITANVDWIAVIVGAILAFMLGSLWYSPKLFGTKWAKGVGVDLGSASSMPVAAMVVQFVATFALAWVVGVTAAQNAVMTILLVVATLVLFVIANGLFVKKSSYAIGVEAGFIAAMTAIMIAVQAIL